MLKFFTKLSHRNPGLIREFSKSQGFFKQMKKETAQLK